jgi:predicted DNA-binding transcriptional regulator YafY
MNRTDRMLGIVLELQSSEYRRAEDLAAAFEVSKRTIYRDIQTLAELGIPIMAMRCVHQILLTFVWHIFRTWPLCRNG